MKMPRIINYYLNFSVRFRLILLCVCYTLCLFAVDFSDEFSRAIHHSTIFCAVLFGALFGALNVWSIHQAIERAVEYLTAMANGDLNQEIRIYRYNEISRMLICMRSLQESVQKLSMDTGMLADAAVNGALATRVDADQHRGDFRKIVAGINNTLDAVIRPLEVAATYVDRIAKGDIPQKITDNYQGDFNVIKNNLNNCIDIMNNLLSETNRVVLAAADGRLDERASVELFVGEWRQLVVRVNNIVTNIVSPLRLTTELLSTEVAGRERAQELLLRHQRELETLNAELEQRVADEVKKSREKDQALMQNEKLASIGQLAAGVAHEINNPLGYISSNLGVLARYFDKIILYDRLQQESGGGGPAWEYQGNSRESLGIEHVLEDGVELIQESLEGSERVTKIVQDLKSFSRIDSLERDPVTLSFCLERALNICANELKYVATIRKEYEPSPEVLCHSGQLNQVFLNLLVNAGQAVTPPGEIMLSCWYDADFVYASVSDNGLGIPDELRERIFEPFFTTKDVGKGTGLGLSISYDIVKKHHGELLVSSVVGQGSTFTVKLPREFEDSFLKDILSG